MNSFKNLKIGKKLILSFLTILILTSSLSIYILGKLSYTANLTDYMYDGPYKLVNESLGIRMEIINISRCLNSGFVDNNHTGENKTIAESFNKIEENIKYAVDYINSNIPQIKVSIPDSTYLLWLDCRNLNLDGDDLVDFFVNKARLALNDGRLFGDGGDGYMRINIACPRRILEKALYQLENAVDSYNFDKYELISGC